MLEELKTKTGLKIIGINLLVMVAYNVICRLSSKGDGFIMALMLVGLHSLICFIAGIVLWIKATDKIKSKAWQLSALLVLLLGFATCWVVSLM